MADLPTGTVTFLFTDVEGSTPLWEQHPAEMLRALARHDAIVEMGSRQPSSQRWVAVALAGLAGAAEGLGQPDRAARLLGAPHAARRTGEAGLDSDQRAAVERSESGARGALGEEAYARALAEGQAMTLEQVAEWALSELPRD